MLKWAAPRSDGADPGSDIVDLPRKHPMLRVVFAWDSAGLSQPLYCKDKGFVNSTKRPRWVRNIVMKSIFGSDMERGISSRIRVVGGQSHEVDFQQNT